jgi:hypothetical protein
MQSESGKQPGKDRAFKPGQRKAVAYGQNPDKPGEISLKVRPALCGVHESNPAMSAAMRNAINNTVIEFNIQRSRMRPPFQAKGFGKMAALRLR